MGVSGRSGLGSDSLTAVTMDLVSFMLSTDLAEDIPFEVADRYEDWDKISIASESEKGRLQQNSIKYKLD